MKSLQYPGKILFVISIAYFGFSHLANANMFVSTVPEYLPYPIIWVYASGLALILATVGIVMGKQAKPAAILLGVLLVLFGAMVHLPGALAGDSRLMTEFF